MFYYYGRKTRFVKAYPQPSHRTVIEPFAGSAAYAHYHIERLERVVLTELDPAIAAMWRQILDPDLSADDICPPCTLGVRTSNPFHLAAAVSGGGPFRYLKATPIMVENVTRWRRRLPGDLRRWRNVQVDLIEGDYTATPDVHGTWFIDPPYQGHAGSLYPFGSKDIDYDALAAWCRTRPGQVIVCEGEGADWLPFQSLGKMVSVRGKLNHEFVYLNGDPGEHGRLI